MVIARSYNNGDADYATLGFAAITGTTLATSNALVTLTNDRRNIQLVNTTPAVVIVVRQRILNGALIAVASAKECAVVNAGATLDIDLFTNKNGYNSGDVLRAYAPVAAISGSLYVVAQ